MADSRAWAESVQVSESRELDYPKQSNNYNMGLDTALNHISQNPHHRKPPEAPPRTFTATRCIIENRIPGRKGSVRLCSQRCAIVIEQEAIMILRQDVGTDTILPMLHTTTLR